MDDVKETRHAPYTITLVITIDAPGELITAAASHLSQGLDSQRARAKAFLEELLTIGPLDATTIKQRAANMNISKTTLQRAKEELHVRSHKTGYGGGGIWIWSLSPKGDQE